ncbi:MAG: TolC family protein [Bacteroidia bacterium]
MKSSNNVHMYQFIIHNPQFIILFLLFPLNANTQSTIEVVLTNIENNNKTIIANTQLLEVQKLQLRTGLNPANPEIEFDYLKGSPSEIGNQSEFLITQKFDFPTAYGKRNQLAKAQVNQVSLQYLSNRQDILLHAKLICLELIYRNKLQKELSQLLENTEKWLNNFQTRLDKGDGNILDVNKAKLRLLEINSMSNNNLSLINQLNLELSELNGGNIIVFTDTIYPVSGNIPDIKLVEDQIISNDPTLKYLAQEVIISRKQVELTRSLTLPKPEIGYHYQTVLNQDFRGIHFGLTIPLWENKNKVKHQKADLLYADLRLQDEQNQILSSAMQQYEKLNNLQVILNEYNTFFETINQSYLLDKSLSMGQISVIEYFMEMSYYYNSFQDYLIVEREYHETIAKLLKFQL